jgi:Glyoxalase-like domain
VLQLICPKLPSRDIKNTKKYYINDLHFVEEADYGNYLIVSKDDVEIHFFEFKDLNELENYGQVYIRVGNIENVYQDLVDRGIEIHPNGKLQSQPWGQKEFSLLDPDHNLLTFGEGV